MNFTPAQTSSDPEAVLADFERRARRVETPCGDGTMVWRVWGSGPAVMLCHGAQGAWSHWIRNIDVLAAGRTVIAPDLPGCGDSAMPASSDHAAISAALAEGLPQVAGDALPLDVIGFSFGGVVATHLAARYPALVRRLIIVDPGGLDTPHGPIDLRAVRGLEGEERLAAVKANLLGLMLHRPESVDAMALHLQKINPRKGRIEAYPLVAPDKLIQALPDVQAPLAAIWGEFDRPHPDPALQESVLRKFKPDVAFRTIPGAGHWSMYEDAEAFNQIALELLNRPI
jgi:2-hydroxy-6-oxonona-2,4-dienedioate hydrolase